jgi:hypothetical protein
MHGPRWLLALIALALLGGGLRWYRLGDWPFSNDERATFEETDSLLGRSDSGHDSQIDRLPRVVPLGYVVHALGYDWFGRDERGSRTMMAVLGTVGCVIFLVLLRPSLGTAPSLATSLLVCLAPAHLFQSQQNRFYITAWLFVALAVLLGGEAVRRRSAAWMAGACMAGLAAVACHTLTIVVLGGLVVIPVAAARLGRQPIHWRSVSVAGVGVAVAAGVLLVYLLPLLRGWNSSGAWGYGVLRSVLGAVQVVGWPVFLLACLGVADVVARRDVAGLYWLGWGLLWLGMVLTLPLVVVFHPDYVFPLAPGVFVLAGLGVGRGYEAALKRGRLVAWSWMGAACLLNMPALASYYRDGSRHDYRTTADFLTEYRRTGDQVAAVSPGLLRPYGHFSEPILQLRFESVLKDLRGVLPPSGRLWIVIPSNRGGLPVELEEWLAMHCCRKFVVRQTRFDYYEFRVEVFLYTAPSKRLNEAGPQ